MLAELIGAKKDYGKFQLDCSFQVKGGSVIGLIGANGAGKSTTFKLLLDLIRPSGGEVRVFGKNAGELTMEEKEKIGVVLSDSMFSNYLDIRAIAPVMEGLYHNFDKKSFLEQCSRFALPLDKKLKEFSTGMKAKLKVLLALSHGAELLILDEPTAGLDVVARDEILDLLRDFMETEGRAILISSHISTDLEGLCDEIYMIDQGRIILKEETDVLLDTYGILKVDEASYTSLDRKYLLRVKKESFGYRCLTNEKNYYMENYPKLTMEKSSLDDIIFMVVKGDTL